MNESINIMMKKKYLREFFNNDKEIYQKQNKILNGRYK